MNVSELAKKNEVGNKEVMEACATAGAEGITHHSHKIPDDFVTKVEELLGKLKDADGKPKVARFWSERKNHTVALRNETIAKCKTGESGLMFRDHVAEIYTDTEAGKALIKAIFEDGCDDIYLVIKREEEDVLKEGTLATMLTELIRPKSTLVGYSISGLTAMLQILTPEETGTLGKKMKSLELQPEVVKTYIVRNKILVPTTRDKINLIL